MVQYCISLSRYRKSSLWRLEETSTLVHRFDSSFYLLSCCCPNTLWQSQERWQLKKLTVFWREKAENDLLSSWWVVITPTVYIRVLSEIFWMVFGTFRDTFPNIITTKEMMLSKRDRHCAGWCHQQLKRGQMCGQTYQLLNFFRLHVYQPMKTSDIKMYEDVDVWLMYDICVCLFNNLFRAPNHCALDITSLRWIRKALHTAASDSFDMYFVLVDAEYLVTIVGGCSTWESHAVQSNMRMDIRFH